MSLDPPSARGSVFRSARAMSQDVLNDFAALLRASATEEGAAPPGADDLERVVTAAMALVADREPGTPKVRIWRAENGAAGPVLQILNDDMPFLVDSVAGELHARGLYPSLLLHPTFKAERDGAGRAQGDRGPRRRKLGGRPAGELHHRAAAADRRGDGDELVAALGRDPRRGARRVPDWRAMPPRLGEAADRLAAIPPPGSPLI